MQRQAFSQPLTTYNNAVHGELNKLNQATAERLMRQGGSLGWWDMVQYFRSQGLSAQAAANRLLEHARQYN